MIQSTTVPDVLGDPYFEASSDNDSIRSMKIVQSLCEEGNKYSTKAEAEKFNNKQVCVENFVQASKCYAAAAEITENAEVYY